MDILEYEFLYLGNLNFVVQPEQSVGESSFVNRPTPGAMEIIAGLGGVNGDLPEILLLVLHALVKPAHHPKVVEFSSFAFFFFSS